MKKLLLVALSIALTVLVGCGKKAEFKSLINKMEMSEAEKTKAIEEFEKGSAEEQEFALKMLKEMDAKGIHSEKDMQKFMMGK